MNAFLAVESTPRFELYINGKWKLAASGKRFDSINPFDSQTCATLADGAKEDVVRAVESARRAFDVGP